jgi:hypothetical protein
MTININIAKTTYILSALTFSHFVSLEQDVKGPEGCEISCSAYLLVSFIIGYIIVVSIIFSDISTISKLDMLSYGSWTYMLVSFHIIFIRAVLKMFSDVSTVSKLDMANCGSWIAQNVSRTAGKC